MTVTYYGEVYEEIWVTQGYKSHMWQIFRVKFCIIMKGLQIRRLRMKPNKRQIICNQI